MLIIVTFPSGCSRKPEFDPDKYLLQQKVDELQTRVKKLEGENLKNELDKYAHLTAEFDPSSSGFQRVDTEVGTFLVMLSDIRPYGDGYRIKVNLGNPSFATYNNVKIHVAWNRRQENVSYDEWQKTLHEQEVVLNHAIRPGSWNSSQVVLAPAKAEETGYIRVSLETPSVSLSK